MAIRVGTTSDDDNSVKRTGGTPDASGEAVVFDTTGSTTVAANSTVSPGRVA